MIPRIFTSKKLALELLEDRLAPDASLPPDLVLGRTPSTHTTAGLTNQQLTVTYTVYNQRAEQVSDARIVTTLQPGVSFSSSTRTVERTGSEVAWTIGAIPAYGRISVSMTLTLASVTEIDTGARVFGTIDGGQTMANTPAITLTTQPLPTELLAATPDANVVDPVVQEQAAKLRYDPQRIFNFLNQDVGYESYSGSLRGARGTIWSAAGNSLDEASLGVALFRASGIPARYAQGTLSDQLSRQMILSMFPAATQLVGYLAPGTTVADPANDPQLLAETRNHYWLQIDTGNGFVNADTSGLPGSGIGTAFTTVSSSFSVVPDNLRHKVRVSLEAETYNQVQGAFNGGNAITTSTVLDRTWNAVELVGKPLSVSQFVTDLPQGGLAFSTRSLTYTPYFLVGDTTDPAGTGDEIFTGTPFQELLTNFPLGSQILTSLKLNMELMPPGGPTEHHERMLIDRIGYANRQNGTTANLSVDASGQAALTNFDLFTITATPSKFHSTQSIQLERHLQSLGQQISTATPSMPNYGKLVSEHLLGITRLFNYRYLQAADAFSDGLAQTSRVRAYPSAPRLIMASNLSRYDLSTNTLSGSFELDLRSDILRTYAAPGQASSVEKEFRIIRGIAITATESLILADAVPAQPVVNTTNVFARAAVENVALLLLLPADVSRVSSLISASPEALTRITDALRRGRAVVAPQRAVTLGSSPAMAWLETDLQTGESIGVGENGAHATAIEYSTLFKVIIATNFFVYAANGVALRVITYVQPGLKPAINNFLNLLAAGLGIGGTFGPPGAGGLAAAIGGGIGVGYYGAGLIGNAFGATDPPAEGRYYDPRNFFGDSNRAIITRPIPQTPGTFLQIATATSSFTADQNTALAIPYTVQTDSADDYLVEALAPEGWLVSLTDRALTVTVAPGTQSGVGTIRLVVRSISDPSRVARTELQIGITPTVPGLTLAVPTDPLFTVTYLGAELPTGYRANIRNLSPIADRYTLEISNVSPGWEVITSTSTLELAAGVTGAIGVYLRPTTSPIPLVGSAASFTVTAISSSNPTLRQSITVGNVMSRSAATDFTLASEWLSGIPSSTVDSSISLRNSGNTTETVTVTAGALPTGYTLVGFPQTVTILPEQSVLLPYSVIIANSVPIHDSAYFRLSINTLRTGSTVLQSLTVGIRVVVPGADAIANAAVSATQLGEFDLANRLNDLSVSLTNLVLSPTDPVARSQSVAALDSVIVYANANSFLSLLNTDFQAARTQLVNAVTVSAVQAAVERLGGLLDGFAQLLGDVVRHGFTFSLATNVVTALPGVPARYPIILENKGTETTTFDFNIASSLPFGMTGSFTQSSVTLQPGERLDGGPSGVFLMLDFTGGALFPESFKISATPQEAPGLSRQAQGSVAVRAEFVQVAVVTPTPAFTNPGGSVTLATRILNAVNREQAVRLSYTVTNSGGSVVYTSPTVPVTLGLQTTLLNVNLPAFDTTGLALGAYSISVTVTDANGTPIPGGTGTASLLIGTPVSGTITVDPATLLAGNGTVTNTLSLTVQTPPANPLTLAGQVQTTPTATTLVTVGNYAYVAGTNGIDIVDVSNPTAPTVVTTFGQGQIVQGGFTVVRAMTGNRIIIATRGVLNASTFDLLTYSIANPTSPTLLGKSTIAESFISDLFVVGDRAIATTYGITFIAGNVIEQFGDVIALDLTNPAAVSVTDELFGNAADNFNQSGGELVNATTLYVASTTSTGGFSSTQSGVGLLRVIDISNPANLTEVRTLTIPNTKHIVEIVIDGNRALLVGSTGGWKSPLTGPGDSQLTGNMTLTLLDITDPLNPLILNSTLITESVNRPVETADGGAKQSTLALGNGLFAVSRGFVNGQPVLLLVDTNDSAGRLAVAAIQVPSLVNEMVILNSQLYTTSAAGLLIYNLATPVFTAVKGSVRVPNSTENRVLTGSFNTLPTTVIPGATFDTLVWDRLVGFGMSNLSFTWQTELSDLAVGESADVTLGTTVDFVSQGTPGSFELPATLVAVPNVLAFGPSTQTVSAGNEATYTITLSNPSTRGITYTLSLQGIPETWATVDRFVVVGPQSSVQVTLRLKPDVFSVGSYGFVLFAAGGGRALGTAQGNLTVLPNNSTVDPNAHGVVATLLPGSTMAGPGGVASYTVRLTNTGSITETFNLSAVLPPQLTGTFAQTNITVPPGISNFRDVSFEISPEVGTAPGALAFTITATSTSSVSTSTANGTLTVAPLGVDLAWDASTGAPGRDFQLTVTNTGQTAETYNLAVAGPSGVVAKLGTNTVTLAPGSSQLVSVATTNLSFATPGEWNLIATATSATQPSVNSRAKLGLTVNPTAAINAEFDRSSYTVTTPTGRDYTLRIDNLGNIEDAFSVTIAGMTGQGNVYLIDPSGRSTSTISPLRLPAYGSGAVTVHADIATAGILAFTVEVRSLAVATNVVTRNATLELSSTVPPPPVIPQLPIVPTVPPILPIGTDIPTLPPPATSRPANRFQVSGRMDGTSTIYAPREGIYSPHSTIEYFAGFIGEVRVATGDVTGDGISDYVGGAGRGGGPRVAIIDGATGLRVGDFFAFEASFRGGIFVAIGDVDGDGRGDVIVTPDLGGGPVVAVYSGRMLTSDMSSESALLNRFFAIENRDFRGGAQAAAGDLDKDGKADLIVSTSFPAGPRIAIFNGQDVMVGLANPQRLTSDFSAFEDTFRNGSFIATGDVNGDGYADLAFGGGLGGGPRIRLIGGAALLARKDLRSLDQASEQNPSLQLANFFAGDTSSRAGVRLAMLDIDGDGLSDLVSGSGDLEQGQVRVVLATTILADSTEFQNIDPMLGENLPNGVFVG